MLIACLLCAFSHAPRERVSWNTHPLWLEKNIQWSRSTWACELKFFQGQATDFSVRHAPRERVSWNLIDIDNQGDSSRHAPRERVSWNSFFVSYIWRREGHAPRERVSWNLNYFSPEKNNAVTLHVSVWVEMHCRFQSSELIQSRSTWACELKFFSVFHSFPSKSHAPRERVSWNDLICSCIIKEFGHAPRERVSWNWPVHRLPISYPVTLHVSVWVEIWRWKHG